MIKRLQTIVLSLIIALAGMFVIATPAYASVDAGCSNSFFGIPTWYEYLDVKKTSDGSCQIITDSSNGGNVPVLIMLAVINILTYLSAIIAVVFVVWGGFMFVSSQGSPDKIASARKTILSAVIGLIIALLASQLVKFVAHFLAT